MFYTYRIEFEDGFYYLGRRKCPEGLTPESDEYVGSPKTNSYYWERGIAFSKKILKRDLTKEEAEKEEDCLIGDLFKTDPLCLNASPANNFSNAGSSWWNDGEKQSMFFEGQEPDGWVPGRLQLSSKGKKYYTNGLESRMFFQGDEPKGWILGNHNSQDPNKNPFIDSEAHNKGKTAYNNGQRVCYFVEGAQPEGWVLGATENFKQERSKQYTGNGNPNFGKRGRKFYHNGEYSKLFPENQQPEGWILGCLKGAKKNVG